MAENKRAVGTHYEDMAVDFLKSLGMDILTRNYKSRHGEIDIIANDNGCIVFCEVKYRSTDRYGMPEEAVDMRKQNRLRYSASQYLVTGGIGTDVLMRFDVIAILGNKIRHIKNAF